MGPYLQEPCGKGSLSRLILYGAFLLVSLAWVGVMYLIAFRGATWDQYEGALTWGRDFLLVSGGPYMVNVLSKAVKAHGQV